ncbi:hypothetical protein PABG_03111 [Paracoccidioides brasiliensis Pb03]|uniref:Amine oxidase domain-containing protein n=1 Tax=Paracoccidioides brasiliensis TaxID=121759 RepID=A0A1D2JQG6_PARBR|nr:hypothetical protein PABG_03111 [Paracoccidioides brasiliensis Pb03]ODH45456.1 hypothetical protein ACO22_00026 [Paracoccidioides brasiliensis]
MASKKVAIVGGGCSGLAAFWALKDSGHEVHLFEAASRLRGLTHLVQYEEKGYQIGVDSGLACFKASTSRELLSIWSLSQELTRGAANLYAFLRELQIPCHDTEFSIASSRLEDSFEWRSSSLFAILSRNLLRLDMWRMLIDIAKFNYFALDLLRNEQCAKRNRPRTQRRASKTSSRPQSQKSIGTFLANEGYSNAFRDNYLVPLIAVLWNVYNPRDALELPIALLLHFLADCNLLRSSLFWSKWMFVRDPLNELEAMITESAPPERIHLNTTVKSINQSHKSGWLKVERGGQIEDFNHVIIATSAHEALRMISASATDKEIQVLSGFQSVRTVGILHSDTTLVPKRKRVWATFNHMTKSPISSTDNSQFCTSFYMNRLQGIPEATYGPVLITLNPISPLHPLRVQGIWEYSRFIFNNRALESQKILLQIQNTRRLSYCGPWTGYGRYEDAVRSAFQVAVDHLGAELPFGVMAEDPSSVVGMKVSDLKLRDMPVRFLLRVVLVIYWILGIVRRVVLYFQMAWWRMRDMKVERGGRYGVWMKKDV